MSQNTPCLPLFSTVRSEPAPQAKKKIIGLASSAE